MTRHWSRLVAVVWLTVVGCASTDTANAPAPDAPSALAVPSAIDPALVAPGKVHLFQLDSPCLTAYWGRSMKIEAGVVLPASYVRGRDYPVCYDVHGFGGSHRMAWVAGPGLITSMQDAGYPEMIYVYLNAQSPRGHHEFADSVNNGPWAQALITEFIPALEARFVPGATARNRFLTGHSSGGWSSLWLQVNYPEYFAGTWSTAPDSVDFRDFVGVDIYSFDNAYVDPAGQEIPLMRRGGKWVMTIREYMKGEMLQGAVGGQFYSFNAVFSPRGEDCTPMRLFNVDTGKIDRAVAESWRKYDIADRLRTHWDDLGPRLAGKLHIYIGDQDTFRLDGSLRLMQADLEALGSDADIIFVAGRDHGSLYAPHPEYWPHGMLERIHREMCARFEATQ